MPEKKIYTTRLNPDSEIGKKLESSDNKAKFLEETLEKIFTDGRDPTKEKPLAIKIKEAQLKKLNQTIEMNKLKTAVMMQKMDTESLRQKSIVQRIEIVDGHKILVDTTLHKIVSGVIKPLWIFTIADETAIIRIFDTYINCTCNKTNPLAYFEYSKHNSKSVIDAITNMSDHVNSASKHEEFSKADAMKLGSMLSDAEQREAIMLR